MEPRLKTGSLVITRPVEPEIIAVGDIITFRPTTVGENLITHRVIGISQSSPRYFQTKGDANDEPDPFTVPARNLAGRVCFSTPAVGYFTLFLKTPLGFLFGMVIPGLIIIVMYVRSSWLILKKAEQTRYRGDEKQELDYSSPNRRAGDVSSSLYRGDREPVYG